MARIEDFSDDKPPLDRWRLDEVLEPNRPLWGLETIGKVLGLSRDATRRLAQLPNVPIYQPPGANGYFAFRSELLGWLKSKQANGNQRIPTDSYLPKAGDQQA